MENKFMPTASHIKYLLFIKKLSENGTGIRSSDLAEKLGISKPSVHNMINILTYMNFVKKESRGLIFFTPIGLETASMYEYYYIKIKNKLFSPDIEDSAADTAICAFLAELSPIYLSELI